MNFDNELMDNANKIKILAILHEGIQVVCNTAVTYIENGIRYVTNLNDDIIVSGDEDKIKIYGTFIAKADRAFRNFDSGNVVIVNVLTGKMIEIKNMSLSDISIANLGTHFIAIDASRVIHKNTIAILNTEFEVLYQIEDNWATRFKLFEDNEIYSKFGYSIYGEYKVLIGNKITGKIDVFDSVELSEDRHLTLVGVAWDKEHKFNINANCIPDIRYKLLSSGRYVGRDYVEITKPTELKNTDYLVVYDYNNEKLYKGIMNEIDGKEIFKPLYNNIYYIGFGNFILESQGMRQIINDKNEVIFDSIPINNIWVHQTLPVTVVLNNGDCNLVDNFGRIFNVRDLSKYFECYYAVQDSEVIKVDLKYKEVYISNKLVPITNIHYINTISTYEWVRF